MNFIDDLDAMSGALKERIAHDAFTLSFNQHKVSGESIEQHYAGAFWISRDERSKAIESDEVWALQFLQRNVTDDGETNVVAIVLGSSLVAVVAGGENLKIYGEANPMFH